MMLRKVRRRRSRIQATTIPRSPFWSVLAQDGERMWARVLCCAYVRACEGALGVGVGRGRGEFGRWHGRWAWAWRVWALAWALGVGVGRWAWTWALGVGVVVRAWTVSAWWWTWVWELERITQNVYMDRHPVQMGTSCQ